jgi:hypothetical protein
MAEGVWRDRIAGWRDYWIPGNFKRMFGERGALPGNGLAGRIPAPVMGGEIEE